MSSDIRNKRKREPDHLVSSSGGISTHTPPLQDQRRPNSLDKHSTCETNFVMDDNTDTGFNKENIPPENTPKDPTSRASKRLKNRPPLQDLQTAPSTLSVRSTSISSENEYFCYKPFNPTVSPGVPKEESRSITPVDFQPNISRPVNAPHLDTPTPHFSPSVLVQPPTSWSSVSYTADLRLSAPFDTSKYDHRAAHTVGDDNQAAEDNLQATHAVCDDNQAAHTVCDDNQAAHAVEDNLQATHTVCDDNQAAPTVCDDNQSIHMVDGGSQAAHTVGNNDQATRAIRYGHQHPHDSDYNRRAIHDTAGSHQAISAPSSVAQCIEPAPPLSERPTVLTSSVVESYNRPPVIRCDQSQDNLFPGEAGKVLRILRRQMGSLGRMLDRAENRLNSANQQDERYYFSALLDLQSELRYSANTYMYAYRKYSKRFKK